MKYNAESKLKMIHEYLEKNQSMLALSEKYGYDLLKIKYMIKLYEMHGEAPFDDRQASRIYSINILQNYIIKMQNCSIMN